MGPSTLNSLSIKLLSNQQCKMPKSLLRSSGSHRLISTWCLISHQPKCNLGVVKFHNEELYVKFQAHFSIAFSSPGSWPHKSYASLTSKFYVLTLPHCQKPQAVSFCSVSIPHNIIWQMHLFVRLKKGFTREMTFKLRHKEKKVNWSLRAGNAVAETLVGG